MGEAARGGRDGRDETGGEGDEAFRAAVEGARPLADRQRARPAPAAPRPRGRGERPNDSHRFEVAEDLSSGRARGVNRETVAGLAAGRNPPEAVLDLHGHTFDMARDRLGRFLAEARASQRRCVLIVTGKSIRAAGAATLHQEVPRWLAGPLSPSVLAFTRARASDGGDGALYVLLRAS